MKTQIVFGSCYGTTRAYAQRLSELTGVSAESWKAIQNFTNCECLIYLGGLYAGGIEGLKQTLKKPGAQNLKRILLVTVGLADPQAPDTTMHIRQEAYKQIPSELFDKIEFFHLRGGIDYAHLNFKHKMMMKMLVTYLKKQPSEKRDAQTQMMLDTYGQKIDFVDFDTLHPIIEAMKGEK